MRQLVSYLDDTMDEEVLCVQAYVKSDTWFIQLAVTSKTVARLCKQEELTRIHAFVAG